MLRGEPGPESPADGFDGRIYYRLVAAVIAVDGLHHSGELDKLAELLEWGGADRGLARPLLEEAAAARQDPLWFLADGKVPPSFAPIYLRDALMAAHADGGFRVREATLIEEAARLMGVESSLPEIRSWVLDSLKLAVTGDKLFGAALDQGSESSQEDQA